MIRFKKAEASALVVKTGIDRASGVRDEATARRASPSPPPTGKKDDKKELDKK